MIETKPILDNKYYIISKIGSGGTSIVYLTEDIKNHNIYATKILKKEDDEEVAINEKEKEKENKKLLNKIKIFKKETEILKTVHNENILNMIDYGEGFIEKKIGESGNKKYQYITLEYAEKGDLFSYIYFPKKGFNEDFGKIIFKGILNGIKACHDKNIIHRDLKLENILLDSNFNPKIADFGIGVILKNNEKLKNITGTRSYQAPEILLKKPYDGRKIDIFSLGVILFIIVTGIKPFEIPFGKDILYKYILKKQYAEYWNQLKQNNPEINFKELSDDFKRLFIKMIQFNPRDRIDLNDIIKCNWLNDNLIDKETVINEFKLREGTVKKHLEISKESSEEYLKNYILKHNVYFILNEDKFSHKKKLIVNRLFNDKIKIPFLETQYGFSNFFFIDNLKVKPVDFINALATSIIKKINLVDEIEPNKKLLRFLIYYTDKEKNNNNDLEEKENEEKFENYLCVVEIKFFEMINQTYCIVFKKKYGEKFDYYNKISELKEIISELLISNLIIEYT